MESQITFAERELYRTQFYTDALFTAADVYMSLRTDQNDDIEMFSDFPTNSSEVFQNPKSPYYTIFWEYALRWWLGQVSAEIDIEMVYILNDIEIEYLSLDRRKITHPMMCKIGNDWCMIKDKWEQDDKLNVIYIGESMLSCFILWMKEIEKNNWCIINKNNNIIDLRTKRLFDEWITIKND